MSGFSVDNFTSALKTSGARSNLFQVEMGSLPSGIDLPQGLKWNNSSDHSTNMTYLCNATTLPGYVQGEIPISYFGRVVYFAGDTTFGDWTTTIINDEKMPIRRVIEIWMENINSTTDNKRVLGVSHNSLTTTAEIKTFTITGSSGTSSGEGDNKITTPITSVKLVGVWPSNISPIELSHDAVNTIETFTVTWQYQHAMHNVVQQES